MSDFDPVIFAVYAPNCTSPVYLTFAQNRAREKAAECGGQVKVCKLDEYLPYRKQPELLTYD